MLIKIDIRETSLLHEISNQILITPIFKPLQIQTETLPIGDIIINDGTEDKIIIERKSINDLLASIKDGRYEEQSYRLTGLNHHNHNIIYLIEGDVDKLNKFKNKNSVEKLTLYSAMFSLNYYKGFSVFRSFSLEESAKIICNMAYKIGKNVLKKCYFSKIEIPETENESCVTSLEVTDKDYVGVIKKIKKENITLDNIGEIMICQIPGISSITAIAVMEKYKTIPNLIKELETNIDSMANLSYTNAKGQIRKVSKTSIANIVKFLLKK